MPDFRFEAIGTAWTITTPAALGRALRARVLALTADYDRAFSRFRPDSLVARLSRDGEAELPPQARALFRLFDRLHTLTDGRMNPLVGGGLARLGYDAALSLRPSGPALPAPPWGQLVRRNTPDGVAVRVPAQEAGPVLLDVGAAGKGQLVDLVAAELAAAGVDEYLVDAGSDMLHRGPAPVRTALEHPYDPSRAIGVLDLRNRALCASASNRRAWGDGLHHVLDAATGLPVSTVTAAWVLADDAMTADGLATALFLTEPSRLRTAFGFDYVRVFSDGRAEFSDALTGVLFT